MVNNFTKINKTNNHLSHRIFTGANHVNMAIIVLSFRSKYVRKSKEINFMHIESKLFKCFECLKSAKYRVVRAIAMAFDATFNNISFISWRPSENHRSATSHQRNIFFVSGQGFVDNNSKQFWLYFMVR
jgi:hypothetical protein